MDMMPGERAQAAPTAFPAGAAESRTPRGDRPETRRSQGCPADGPPATEPTPCAQTSVHDHKKNTKGTMTVEALRGFV